MGLPPALALAPPGARAREAPHELPALPPEPEQATLARRVLLDIAVNGGGPDAGARVGAAKALLEVSTTAETAITDLMGSPEKALEWMRGILPRLEMRVAERAAYGPEDIQRRRSGTELLAAIRAALPNIEALAAAEAEAASKRATADGGEW